MADPRAEMLYNRGGIPADTLDSAPAPVVYTRYAQHGPAVPNSYDAPPLPPYDPVVPYAPSYFLPPYELEPEPPRFQEFPPEALPERLPAKPPPRRVIPPSDVRGGLVPNPAPYREQPLDDDDDDDEYIPPIHARRERAAAPPPMPPRQPASRRELPPDAELPMHALRESRAPPMPPRRQDVLPPHEPPPDMVVPGVMHPDGHFEPHPLFARRSLPGPPGPHGPLEPHGPPMPYKAELEKPEEPTKKTVEVAVPVCCEECGERIISYLDHAPGVEDVDVDVQNQTVKVTGDVEPQDVLNRCRKCFRKSTLV